MKAYIQAVLKYLKKHPFTSQVIKPGAPTIDQYLLYFTAI